MEYLGAVFSFKGCDFSGEYWPGPGACWLRLVLCLLSIEYAGAPLLP